MKVGKVMILFLVNTPMQLMNAAILAKTEFAGKCCDIYYTKNVKSQAENLLKKNFFNNIYEISLVEDVLNRSNKLNRALVRIKNALDLNKIKKTLPSDPMQYDRILASGVSLRNFEIYYAIKSLNKKVKLSLYEEGICEYYYMAKKSIGKILFSYIFFGRYYLNDCDSLYVHSPELVSIAWDHIKLHKICDIKDKYEILNDLSDAMYYKPTLLKDLNDCIVVLEQAFYNKDQEDFQKKIIEDISNLFSKEKVIIKLHPRSPLDKYDNEYKILETKAPFEIVALNEDILSHTFVSVTSSAVLNFKMMLNMEPKTILLNRMATKNNDQVNEFDKLVLRVQNQYSNSNLLIPYSNDEFIEFLKKEK